MQKALKLLIISFFLLAPFSVIQAQCGAGFDQVAGVCIPNGSSAGGLSATPVETIIANFMQWLLYIFGFLAIIAFVISGIQYITSIGDQGRAETAKRNMIYSIVGVAVGLSGIIVINAIQRMLEGDFF